MKKVTSNFMVIASQLFVLVLFFVTIFDKNIKVEDYKYTVENKNLNKIATSVSLLFKDENIALEENNDDYSLNDLPAGDNQNENVKIEEKKEKIENVVESTPLYSIDAEKYSNYEKYGFKVTEGNKQYSLTDYEFDVVVAVVSGEFDKNLDDALGVVSVILNRCDSPKWQLPNNTPYTQVIRSGQFEVYFAGMYLDYMPGGKYYQKEKYNIAKQAVLDGLNGIRNNEYLGFRAWWVSGYSDKYIVSGGNRYGYN